MNDFYDHIQYVVPENTEIFFDILPETRDVSLKLLDGVADIYVIDEKIRLPLQQEFSMQIWHCSCPRLYTKTGCNFLVRGNHYVSSAVQHGRVTKQLFGVSPCENSYSFVLEKDIQLQVFPANSTERRTCVTIERSRGAPESSGFNLLPETIYDLTPFSPVLFKSSDEKPYSVYVHGFDRKVKLSIRDENHHKCVNDLKERIIASYFLANRVNRISPTILVLGPKNAGKTSFCHLLVSEILEKKMTPIYVDLNVKRNVSVPGSLSLSEIEGRKDSTLNIRYNIQRLLQYGSLVIHSASVRFYYFLVRKMGGLLSIHLNYNNKENCFAVIDTDGYHGENNKAIEILLKSFVYDYVVYLGDEQYYENLKTSVLENVLSEFIPKPRSAEQPSDSYESRFYQYRIQKYFFNDINSYSRRPCIIAFHHFTMYRISTSRNDTNAKSEKASDYKLERVDFDPNTNRKMLHRLFGVSASKRADLRGIAEIQYYVYFTDIDMADKMVTLMAPESENFEGGILLMGHILLPEKIEIISY